MRYSVGSIYFGVCVTLQSSDQLHVGFHYGENLDSCRNYIRITRIEFEESKKKKVRNDNEKGNKIFVIQLLEKKNSGI